MKSQVWAWNKLDICEQVTYLDDENIFQVLVFKSYSANTGKEFVCHFLSIDTKIDCTLTLEAVIWSYCERIVLISSLFQLTKRFSCFSSLNLRYKFFCIYTVADPT